MFLHHVVQMYLVRSGKMAEQSDKSHQRQLAVMLLMSRPRWTFRFGLRRDKGIGLIVSRARKCRNESLNVVQPHGDQGHGRGRRRPAEGVAQLHTSLAPRSPTQASPTCRRRRPTARSPSSGHLAAPTPGTVVWTWRVERPMPHRPTPR